MESFLLKITNKKKIKYKISNGKYRKKGKNSIKDILKKSRHCCSQDNNQEQATITKKRYCKKTPNKGIHSDALPLANFKFTRITCACGLSILEAGAQVMPVDAPSYLGGIAQDEEHSFPQTGCQAQSPGHQTDRVRHATRAPHPGRWAGTRINLKEK